jgi:hypothetical protein
MTSVFAPNFNVAKKIELAKTYSSDKEEILGITDDNSIIISRFHQGLVFGQRKSYYINLNYTEMLEHVQELIDNSHDVYLIDGHMTHPYFMASLNTTDVLTLKRSNKVVKKINFIKEDVNLTFAEKDMINASN